jgi:tRNA(fMet)-specific endonuclease VapC
MLILDTDHVEALKFDGDRKDRLVQKLEAADEHEIATTIITVEENLVGWLNLINRYAPKKQVPLYARIGALLAFYEKWNVLPFNDVAASEFVRLRGLVRKTKVKDGDLKIAARARCNNGIVLTRNVDHFKQMPGVGFEDWLTDRSSSVTLFAIRAYPGLFYRSCTGRDPGSSARVRC